MSKATATAVIRFYPDKTVTVELSSLVGVSPRRLERAGHLLMREYRGKRAAHNAKRHRLANQKAAREEKKAATDEEAFHKAEDERLAEAAKPEQEEGEKRLKSVLKKMAAALKGGEEETK